MPISREFLETQKSPDIKDDACACALVRFLSREGFHNKRIAALFDVNQGRISEIVNGEGRHGITMLRLP